MAARQQIYVMAANGGAAQRISFGEGSYSTPVWSPRGDYIAFTGQARGNFAIGILKPDGSGERMLTEGFHNEGPTFAPNGRVLMFFRDVGQGPSLYTVDITGRNEQKVPTPSFRFGSGLVAAFVLIVVNRPYFHCVLTIRNGLRGSGSFNGSTQGPIKVDGTFV